MPGNDKLKGDRTVRRRRIPSRSLDPISKHAMVLAAGFGLRLRPITEKLPKPLVKVGGRPLIDRVLDRLEEVGIEKVVVNLHHLGHLIEHHLARRKTPSILYSREQEILETGGGITHALPHFGGQAFIAVNSDVFWLNGPRSAMSRMAEAWDDAGMDGLLLLHTTVDGHGYEGSGDFHLDAAGLISPRPESDLAPFLFTGLQILHPRLFDDAPTGPFPLGVLYDRAIEAGRLYGIVHDGEWFHIGSPEGLANAEVYLRDRFPVSKRR